VVCYIFNFDEEIAKYDLNLEQYENCLRDIFGKVRRENDLDWSEIIEKYNLPIAKDTLRKASSQSIFGSVFVHEYLKCRKLQDDDIHALQKERYKIQAEKVELNRILRQYSRFELFYEKIKESIQVFPVPQFEYEINTSNKNKEHILTISDVHAGAKFKSENNEFSYEECTKRFNKLFSYMVNYIQENNISQLKIINGGDDIQGLLRITDVKLNESAVVNATVFIAKLISQFLNDLSNYCCIEYYQVPTSNHSQTRPLGTKASEIASEDIEYIIGNYIKDVLVHNPRIVVNTNFGKDYINIPIFNFNAIALHGHTIKNVKNAIKDLSMLHRKFYDYCFLSHFHASEELTVGEGITNDVEVLICPSMVGSCPYSDKLMKGAKASCKVFVFEEINGHTRTDKIILN
jgi:hypothetical protein